MEDGFKNYNYKMHLHILCNKEIYDRYMRQFLIFVMQAFYTIVANMIDVFQEQEQVQKNFFMT